MKLAAGLPYLVIGGHAINAYGEPRSTIDVDFVVRREDKSGWGDLLAGEGFRPLRETEGFLQFAPPYGVNWRLDLMLVNAETFTKLAAHSRTLTCLGVETGVPSPEHLVAMKLHAMTHGPEDRYERDFGDILNLFRNAGLDVNSPAVVEVFGRFGTQAIYERVRQLIKGRPG